MSYQFNKSKSKIARPNTFQLIGKPLFRISLFFITQILFCILFISKSFAHSKAKVFNIRIPTFRLSIPKIKIPKISLSFPQVSLPKISLPKKKPSPDKPKKTAELPLPKISLRFIYKPSFILFVGFSILIYYFVFYQLPNPASLKNLQPKQTTYILDRNGEVLYKIFKDENRTLVNFSELPLHVKQAFLSAEDKDFYRHHGLNVISTLRAAYKTITGQRLEGGSTITQQLIKNTLLTPEKTLQRKLKELVLAIETEFFFDKDTIFSMYLNQVGFGGTAYGIQEASQQYFATDAAKLSISQAAFLAGITQAPSKYSPFSAHPEMAKPRQIFVLEQMKKNGFISEEQLATFSQEKLDFNTPNIAIKAPHFVMFVRDLLVDQFGEELVNHGGLKITTTLDLKIQNLSQDIVSKEIKNLQKLNINNGAALVTNPQNGDILAMVGSKNFFDLDHDGQVNITTSLRQPGSAIKPLNYALALEKGYTPNSILDDKPIIFRTAGQEPWIPKNYDNKFHGPLTLRQALANSYNIPAVMLLANNGIDNFAKLAKNLGINTWNDPKRYGLSMTLGSLEVKMTELATAYSAFANSGKPIPLRAILKIESSSGEQLSFKGCSQLTPPPPQTVSANSSCIPQQVISPNTAFLISDILSDNNARSAAFGYNSVLNIPKYKVSVKTGTSNDLKDNWTIGYTPDILVATWVGNNNNTPMSYVASGITGASPIWNKIITETLKPYQAATSSSVPKDIIKVSVCPLTGTLACDTCPNRYEYFTSGTQPKTHCTPEQIKAILSPTPTPTFNPKPQIL